jgi:hypothetical protein
VPDSPQLLTAGLFAQNIKVTTIQNISFEGYLLKLGLLAVLQSADGYQHFSGTYCHLLSEGGGSMFL